MFQVRGKIRLFQVVLVTLLGATEAMFTQIRTKMLGLACGGHRYNNDCFPNRASQLSLPGIFDLQQDLVDLLVHFSSTK